MYTFVGAIYFAVYLPAWLCSGRPLLATALAAVASAAWMTIADRRYGYPWLWWTGRRIDGKRRG